MLSMRPISEKVKCLKQCRWTIERSFGGSEKMACCSEQYRSILSATSSGNGSGSGMASIGDSSSSLYFHSRVEKGISASDVSCAAHPGNDCGLPETARP